MQGHKTLIAVIKHRTIYGIKMLIYGRIEQFWMLECCVVTNISWTLLFNSNLKAFESALYIYICGITATLTSINQICLLEDSEHILMNHGRIIRVCNWGRNHIGNQLARRSNPRRSNINWAFRRARCPSVIHKLIYGFDNGFSNEFLKIPITQNNF